MTIQPPNVPRRVLLVEPNEALCSYYSHNLQNYFYDVKTAGNGLECLASLQAFAPDVLVLNDEIAWGGGDGILACLQEDNRLQNTSVILATSRSSSDYQTGRPLPSVVCCLRTPYEFSELLEAVRHAVASHDYAWKTPRDCSTKEHHTTHSP